MREPEKKEGTHWVWWTLGGILAAALGYAIFKRDKTKQLGEATMEVIVNTFQSHGQFIHRIWDALTRNSALSITAKTILTAQAIHEASWGAASGSRKGYNYWNLTAGSKWKGPVIYGKDLEFTAVSPNPKTITQAFRRYDSDSEAIKDLVKFIGPGTRYDKAWSILNDESIPLAQRVKDYVYALHDAGFFTQPPELYHEAVRKHIQDVISTLG